MAVGQHHYPRFFGRLIAAACNTALKTVGTRKGMGIDTSVFRIYYEKD